MWLTKMRTFYSTGWLMIIYDDDNDDNDDFKRKTKYMH